MKLSTGAAVSRRRFLRGAGGVAIGLPFLESLEPRALAQPRPGRLPRFVSMGTPHGGVFEANTYPPDADLTTRQMHVPGHEIAMGPLVRRTEGADAFFSPGLRAPADELSAGIAAKINILRGFDLPFHIGHHTGGHLGNFARNDAAHDEAKHLTNFPMPTIDQVMGWSPAFYRDLSGIRERVITPTPIGRYSYYWSNPGSKSGSIQDQRATVNTRELFDRLFVPSGGPPVPARRLIVDRVLEDYRRLRNGSRRISAGDKQRLDDHLARLGELDRRLGARPATVSGACSALPRAANAEHIPDRITKHKLYNDVVVAAFLCGTSRIAAMPCDVLLDYSGDWHAEIAHQWFTPRAQEHLVENNRLFFRHVFLDLARKLDVEEAPGVTVLDNTLIAWSQEAGMQTHDTISLPLITAGAAAGALRTGLYCDYRNRTMRFWRTYKGMPDAFHGVLWHQWLATALTAMGVPRAEYARPEMKGYGFNYASNEYRKMYAAGVVERADEPLPFLGA